MLYIALACLLLCAPLTTSAIPPSSSILDAHTMARLVSLAQMYPLTFCTLTSLCHDQPTDLSIKELPGAQSAQNLLQELNFINSDTNPSPTIKNFITHNIPVNDYIKTIYALTKLDLLAQTFPGSFYAFIALCHNLPVSFSLQDIRGEPVGQLLQKAILIGPDHQPHPVIKEIVSQHIPFIQNIPYQQFIELGNKMETLHRTDSLLAIKFVQLCLGMPATLSAQEQYMLIEQDFIDSNQKPHDDLRYVVQFITEPSRQVELQQYNTTE